MKITTLAVLSMTTLALSACATGSSPWPKSRAKIEAVQPTCADFKVSVYFDRDDASLTREARSVLTDARTLVKGCTVEKARVVGLADAVGASEANLALSKRRAASVTQALTRAGFKAVELDQLAVGDAGAVSADGVASPLRRRADIFFHMAKPRT